MQDEARVTFEEDEFYRKGSYNKITLNIPKEDGYINATRIDKDVRNYLGEKTWPMIVIYRL
jgi:non-ribosomal peptide synthetase component E (peptide arylation enzyme)